MKAATSLLALLISATIPAFAGVTVTAPSNGAKVVSPFLLAATASPCSTQTISAMGYSFDTGATTIVNGAWVNALVSSANGSHVLHVKSWGNKGASCVTDISLTVVSPPTAAIPSGASVSQNIQTLSSWNAVNDTGTGSGSSYGSMALVAAPSLSGIARQFATTYTNNAGQRYYVSFGADSSARNFLYDGWVYLASPSTAIANLELDMNQVIANGQTVIYGFQCDGWTHTWDYTANTGTAQNYKDQWIHSQAPCYLQNWGANSWHHIQISYSRDDLGNVTYHSVWLDNVEQDLNVTVNSSFALGWGQVLLTNFQVDGMGASGSATVYLDNLTIYRW